MSQRGGSQSAALAVDSSAVTGALTNVIQQREQQFAKHIETARTQLLDVALTVSDMGSSELLSVLKEEYAGLLRLEQEVKAHQGALLDVAQEYQPPTQANNPTDIDKKLAKKAKRHLARDGVEAHIATELRTFDQQLGVQTAGEDDDDIVMEGGSILVNDKCPITLTPVLELEDPVEDQVGYVYDKKAILGLVDRGRGQPVPCPVQGTSHRITRADLKPSKRVVREKRRQAMQGTTQAGAAGPSNAGGRNAAAQDVYDADELV